VRVGLMEGELAEPNDRSACTHWISPLPKVLFRSTARNYEAEGPPSKKWRMQVRPRSQIIDVVSCPPPHARHSPAG
jgi:hypothetical protein